MWVGEWLAERECYECESGLVDNVDKMCRCGGLRWVWMVGCGLGYEVWGCIVGCGLGCGCVCRKRTGKGS